MTRSTAGGESVDDLFDVVGDDIAADEVRIVENCPEEALGEQMGGDHVLDGGDADVGVERTLTELEEAVEGALEFRVRVVGSFDALLEVAGEFGDGFTELGDGFFVLLNVGFCMGVEEVKQADEFGEVGEIEFADRLAVLNESGAEGVLEDDVVLRVTALVLAADLGVEVVGGVLRLPVAAREVEFVADGAVGTDGALGGGGGRVPG